MAVINVTKKNLPWEDTSNVIFLVLGKEPILYLFCDVTCEITTFGRSSYYLTYLVLTFPIVIRKLIFLVRTELLNWANLVKLVLAT